MAVADASPAFTPFLTKNLGKPGMWTFDAYTGQGGYTQWKRVLQEPVTPAAITDEVKKSGIRGRGGAGFPVAMKWGTLPPDTSLTRYMVVNGDESEPGTCHDRYMIEEDPHLVLEGAMITSYAVNSHQIFIYLRGEFGLGAERMQAAIDAAYEHGLLGKNILNSGYQLDALVYRGAGAYICGEETALIMSLNGNRGITRLKPPYFPTARGGGVFGMPTVMQNVQTVANMPYILATGGDAYAKVGSLTSGRMGPAGSGPLIFSVSGHVRKPGNYEIPMGVTMRSLIYDYCGGMIGDKKVKAVIPGGGTSAWMTPDQLDTKLDFDSLPALGFGYMLGTGATTVMSEDVCIPHCLSKISYFYHHESCGECTPCREGGAWIYKTLMRVISGSGRAEDIPLMKELCDNIEGKTLCAFGYSVTWPVRWALKIWPEEFDYHIKHGACPAGDHPFGTTGLMPAI